MRDGSVSRQRQQQQQFNLSSSLRGSTTGGLLDFYHGRDSSAVQLNGLLENPVAILHNVFNTYTNSWATLRNDRCAQFSSNLSRGDSVLEELKANSSDIETAVLKSIADGNITTIEANKQNNKKRFLK